MAAPARPSSTVVLVRQVASADAWETYLVRRSAQSPVLADLWVFPGGTLRPDDRSPEVARLCVGFSPDRAHAALSRPPASPASTPEESLAYFVAAARELFEEAGVLLARLAISNAATRAPSTTLTELRGEVERGRPFAEALDEVGLELELERLIYYAHWITPEPIPVRFDTRFFLAELPEGQEAAPGPVELAEGVWITASEVLERNQSGTLALHFATLNHIRRLAPFGRLPELLEFTRTKQVHTVMPVALEREGRVLPRMPGELDGIW